MIFRNTLCCIWLLLAISACNSPSPTTSSDPVAQTIPSSTAMISKAADPVTRTHNSPEETAVDPSTAVPPTPTATENEITFIKTFGGNRRDRGINLLQTADGGYAIIGLTSSLEAIQEDVYLVRLDPQGEVLWTKTYGGEGDDNGWDILQTEDGGFLIAGFTNSFGAGEMDIYLIRTDATGKLLWERTFGGPKSEYGWSMAPAFDGGYVLAGQTDSYGEGDIDGYLVKVNAEGEEIWSQTFGGPQEDRLFSIDQSADSGFVVAGTTRSFGAGSRDVYLLNVNNSGEVVWTGIFGEKQDDVGHAVRQTAEGGYIVTGYTKSFGARNYDTWLIKTDEVGDLLWQKFFGEAGDDRTIYGEQTDDGGYISTGYTTSFDSIGLDLFLMRTDSSGQVTWHKTFGGRAEDTGYTVKQTADHGFVLTGETYSSGEGGGDMVVIKVNQDGEIIE